MGTLKTREGGSIDGYGNEDDDDDVYDSNSSMLASDGVTEY